MLYKLYCLDIFTCEPNIILRRYELCPYNTDHNFPSQTILKKKWRLIFVWNYFFVPNRFGGKCPNLPLVIHYTFSRVTYFMNHETCLNNTNVNISIYKSFGLGWKK